MTRFAKALAVFGSAVAIAPQTFASGDVTDRGKNETALMDPGVDPL